MKKISIFNLAAIAATLLLVSCASTPKKAEVYANLYSENPTVMLIMPPINSTTNVEAKDFFYTTISVPIAESGYYVLPPAACYATMQRESAYDSERFIDGDLKKFNQLFGADVAIFTIIKKWEKHPIYATIDIELEYIFKSTKTNEVLYNRDVTLIYDTSANVNANGAGLLGSLINITANAIKTAVTDYVKVAIQCNAEVLADLPYGKYHSEYQKDLEKASLPKKMTVRINNN